MSTLLFTCMSAGLAGSALADDAVSAPAFATMDNTGDGSKIALDLAVIVPTDHAFDDVLVRPSILGQYVAPSGFGGYAGISMSKLIDDGGSGTGNLEFGGLFHRALSSNFDLGARIGLVVPTAGNHDSAVQAVSTLIARPSDLVTAIPETTWLRFGASPTYHRGPVFLRADLGVDVPLLNGNGLDPIGHLNVGAGLRGYAFSATAELQNVFIREHFGDATEIETFHTIGLSGRYQGKGASPFVSVSTPLEDGLRGEVITVTTGLTIPF